MTLEEKLQYCKICTKRSFDLSAGVVCSLTKAKPDFDEGCISFVLDEKEAQKVRAQMEARAKTEQDTGFFAPEKKGMQKGVVGGIVMMAIAAIWFFGGLAANVIFYYPPVLFIIGLIALIKGAAQGNFAGEKYRKVS